MFRTISVAALVMVLGAGTGWAQFRTVTVQNANTNPVPTTVQNTVPVTGTVNVGGGNVGITGTPTVNVGTVGALPAVQITGTPAVNVANTPNVAVTAPVGTAGPGNTTGVLIKNLDDPARQPFQQQVQCSTTAGGANNCSAGFSVPAGKQLVIEYLQLQSYEVGSSATAYYDLITRVNGTNAFWAFPPGPKVFNPFANAVTIGEHQLRIYADGSSNVTLAGIATSNATVIQFTFTVSGYLVNVP